MIKNPSKIAINKQSNILQEIIDIAILIPEFFLILLLFSLLPGFLFNPILLILGLLLLLLLQRINHIGLDPLEL